MRSYTFEESNGILSNIIHNIGTNEHLEKPWLAWKHIDKVMRVLYRYPEDDLFISADSGNGTKQVNASLLASAVMSILGNCIDQIATYYPIYTFNPYIEIFVRHASNGRLVESIQRHGALRRYDGIYRNEHEYSLFVDMANALADFVRHLRLAMQTQEFKTMMHNAERLSHKNFMGVQNYINALFDRYARLLVLRVDFGYLKDSFSMTVQDIHQKYWEAKYDFKHFLDNMGSNRLFKHVVGKIWKLEFGPDKSWHYHVMFFLDGSKVREDEILALLTGKYWEERIANNGMYHNCNAYKNDYEARGSLGIGMINYYDQDLREGLNQAAFYLTKPDLTARNLMPEPGRTFGRGTMPESNCNHIGRPRSFDPYEVSTI